MLVHLAARIKMGVGDVPAPAANRSPGQAEHQKERAVELFGCFRVDAADHPPNPVTTERDQFVRHDLRPKAKTVLWCGFD